MAYHIKFISAAGDESDTYWPADEESARRHAVEQVVAGKSVSARVVAEDGTVIAHWPDDAATDRG